MTTRETADSFQTLNVMYLVAESLVPVIRDIKRVDRNLADQLQRAATSVMLNLSEGSGSAAGNRTKHYQLAQGSLFEMRTALRIAHIWNYPHLNAQLAHNIDRVAAMTYRLLHPK